MKKILITTFIYLLSFSTLSAAPIKNGFDLANSIIPSVNTFWFAWYAFHPKAVVFKGK